MHPIHPMVVHFPIALLIVSTAIEAVAWWRPSEKLRDMSLLLLAMGVAAAGAAVITGHFAEEAAEAQKIAESTIEIHEQVAFVASAIFGGLLAWRLLMRLELLGNQQGLALAAALVGAMALSVAGYLGGDLVYTHGAGVAGHVGRG